MKKNNLGFTLTELLVVIAIMGIMAAFAMPSLTTFISNTRITNRAEQMANLFRFAKGEAVRLNAPVIVCGTNIRSDGRPDGVCRAIDSNGWRAFADINRNGAYDSNTDLDLRTISFNSSNNASSKKVEITAKLFNITGSVINETSTEFVFMPNGTFGRTKQNSSGAATSGLSSLVIGDSFVGFTMTDVESKSRSKPLTRVVMVAPSGTPTVCSGFDEAVAQNKDKINLSCGLK